MFFSGLRERERGGRGDSWPYLRRQLICFGLLKSWLCHLDSIIKTWFSYQKRNAHSYCLAQKHSSKTWMIWKMRNTSLKMFKANQLQ